MKVANKDFKDDNFLSANNLAPIDEKMSRYETTDHGREVSPMSQNQNNLDWDSIVDK